VAELRRENGNNLRAVDIKPFNELYQCFPDVENLSLDLNLKKIARRLPRAPQIFISLQHGWDGI
jgi:hypothetical protein